MNIILSYLYIYLTLQEIDDWFGSIVMELNASTHHNRFVSAVAIMYCLYNLHQHESIADLDVISSLISMIEIHKCNIEFLLNACTDGIR